MTLQEEIYHTKQIASAIQRRERYYTIKTDKFKYRDYYTTNIMKLPTPQVCGTMTQQRSYAVDKAQQIIEQYKTL